MLRTEVARQVVDVATAEVAGRLPLLVGVGATSTARTLANLDLLGAADYAVVTGPGYFPVTDEEALEGHFVTVADSSPVPIILYNVPQNISSALSPTLVSRLSEHPKITGIKDSGGDMLTFHGYLDSASAGFAVLQGREQLAAESQWLGAAGVVSALANVAPSLLRDLRSCVIAGETERALEVQRSVATLATIFDQAYWLTALKAAIELIGFEVGRPARPVPPATAYQRAAIRAILNRHGLGREPTET